MNEKKLYKSIVISMLICLPAGIGLGIIKESIILGLLAGNTIGFVLGFLISHLGNT